MSVSVEPLVDFDPDDVKGWLLSLESGLPSDRRWKSHEHDPVEELYTNVNIPPPHGKKGIKIGLYIGQNNNNYF